MSNTRGSRKEKKHSKVRCKRKFWEKYAKATKRKKRQLKAQRA